MPLQVLTYLASKQYFTRYQLRVNHEPETWLKSKYEFRLESRSNVCTSSFAAAYSQL
jgi:hypothetical protein